MSSKRGRKGGLFEQTHVITFFILLFLLSALLTALIVDNRFPGVKYIKGDPLFGAGSTTTMPAYRPKLDVASYEAQLRHISHLSTSTPLWLDATTTATSTMKRVWPVKTLLPNYGAILPFKRVVAYYGNFYSKGMGVLGATDEGTMKARLLSEVASWNAADSATPAIPAIDYIALTAQLDAGKDGKYRARMPGEEIEKAIRIARSIDGIVVLDVQVGLSDLQTELPLLAPYLSEPDVHLAIDPEFAMHNGQRPGQYIGTFDATDINYAARFLADLVQKNDLPPKILVIHRFTREMVTNYKQIRALPEVQIVMDMDGWGGPEKKINTYETFIQPEPVQFTGFKLFYKNDILPPSTRMLTPSEIIKLTPSPIFIQYQ